MLHLDVEASPPLVLARTRTSFRIDPDQARSDATIDLQSVRGRLFDVELDVGPGLRVVAVGPSEMVERWILTARPSARDAAKDPAAQVLKIHLSSLARDQPKVSLRLAGYQRILRDGPVKLGLFAPDPATCVGADYELFADRSLSLELDDDSGRVTRSADATSQPVATSPIRAVSTSVDAKSLPSLVLSGSGGALSLAIRIARHARSVTQQTVLSADVTRSSVDVVQESTFTVRHGTLDSLNITVPAAIADRWELLGREVNERENLGGDSDGARRYRLFFDRPVLDKVTLRFRFHRPIGPQLDAAGLREMAIPWIAFQEAVAGPARLEVSTSPGIVFRGSDPAWILALDDGPSNRGSQSLAQAFTEGPGGRGRPFAFKATALEPVELPPLVVPRLLIRSVPIDEVAIRSRAHYWVETHGPVFSVAMPEGARWIAARVDGRTTDQVEFDSTRGGYRLRFPPEVGSRPVLVELEYQINGKTVAASCQPPRLLDEGMVLETLWELQLPWDQALVGVPRGWFDENEWYWTGRLWKRRAWKDGVTLSRWLGGSSLASAADEPAESRLDDTHRLLFSRPGPPIPLAVLAISRTWIVVACSGVTLILGFLAIFSRIRFRTAWAVVAVFALLALGILQPSVTLMVLQSSFIGAALSLLGVLIQHLLDRPEAAGPPRPRSEPVGGGGHYRRVFTRPAGHRWLGRLDGNPRPRLVDDGLRPDADQRARARARGVREELDDGADLSRPFTSSVVHVRMNRTGIPINHDSDPFDSPHGQAPAPAIVGTRLVCGPSPSPVGGGGDPRPLGGGGSPDRPHRGSVRGHLQVVPTGNRAEDPVEPGVRHAGRSRGTGKGRPTADRDASTDPRSPSRPVGAGLLTGRTELVIGALTAGPSELSLEPWTPTIVSAPKPATILGARDSGTAVVRVEPSPGDQTLTLEWELRSRPHSRGQGFTLGLPGDQTTVLELDLPKGWIVSSRRGIRQSSGNNPDPTRTLWEIDGESGRFNVDVRDPKDGCRIIDPPVGCLGQRLDGDRPPPHDRTRRHARQLDHGMAAGAGSRPSPAIGSLARPGPGADRRARPRGPRLSDRTAGVGDSRDGGPGRGIPGDRARIPGPRSHTLGRDLAHPGDAPRRRHMDAGPDHGHPGRAPRGPRVPRAGGPTRRARSGRGARPQSIDLRGGVAAIGRGSGIPRAAGRPVLCDARAARHLEGRDPVGLPPRLGPPSRLGTRAGS